MNITHLRAPNPGPLTLSGTNTYVVERAWVVDPGPLDDIGVGARERERTRVGRAEVGDLHRSTRR